MSFEHILLFYIFFQLWVYVTSFLLKVAFNKRLAKPLKSKQPLGEG